MMVQECRYQTLLLALLILLVQQSTAAPALREYQEPQPRTVRLLDRFNHRYPDGSYEFRFELDDGTARYERGYFAIINEVKTLMVVGYYSYRMPDNRYITVFYNADQFGYRQNQSITPEVYPNLPRSIEVPMLKESNELRQQTTAQPQYSRRQPSTTTSTTSTSSSSSSTSSSVNYASSLPKATSLPTRRGRY